jgi:4a-hydroxytetrahydrobiopterin dehydratase
MGTVTVTAVGILDLAREQGLVADPALIQTVQVAFDALVSADVTSFWAAVLGYERRAVSPDEDLIDPRWRGPSIWFQPIGAPRPQRSRFDVWVPPNLASASTPRPGDDSDERPG